MGGAKLANTITRRLTPQLDAMLGRFCQATSRQQPHTLRQIVALFFADGFDAAKSRLDGRIWQIENRVHSTDSGDMDQWTAEERAVWLTTGEPPPRLKLAAAKRA